MDSFYYTYKRGIFIYLFYSLLMHAIVLFFLLKMPIFNTNFNADLVWGYLVSFREEFVGSEMTEVKKDIKIIPSLSKLQKKGEIEGLKLDKESIVKKSNDFEENDNKTVVSENKDSSSMVVQEPPVVSVENLDMSDISMDEVVLIEESEENNDKLAENKDDKPKHLVINVPLVNEDDLLKKDINNEENKKEGNDSLIKDITASEKVEPKAIITPDKKNVYSSKHSIIEIMPEKAQEEEPLESVKNIQKEEKTSLSSLVETSVIFTGEKINEQKKQDTELEVVKETVLPVAGLSIPDIFISKDLIIEVVSDILLLPDISVRLFKKMHPKENYSKDVMNEIDVQKEALNERNVIYSLVKAEKGVYVFELKNGGKDVHKLQIRVLLYEKTDRKRIREYKNINLDPGESEAIKFLIPEAIFWDDDDYFSGSIEDSKSITKFNHDAGIAWKEKK